MISSCLALCLPFAAVYGQEGKDISSFSPRLNSQTNAALPSIEQVLVPEGLFAVQLVEALKLGSGLDESDAESLLSGIGIEPKNGWLSDYPVTPAVIGDLEQRVKAAVQKRKIAMTQYEAMKAIENVKIQVGLQVHRNPDTPVGPKNKPRNTTIYGYTDREGVIHITDDYGSIPAEYRDKLKIIKSSVLDTGSDVVREAAPQEAANPNPEMINNYYMDQGPPVVTYYPPPDPYSYLYSRVAYPFWSSGYYFPGYFVLQNFHRRVAFHQRPYFVAHHVGGGVYRGTAGIHPGSGTFSPDSMSERWFSSPSARAGASAIVTLNQNHLNALNATPAARLNGLGSGFPPARWVAPLGNSPGITSGPVHFRQGNFLPAHHNDVQNLRSFGFGQSFLVPSSPRIYFPPVYSQHRTFGTHHRFSGGFGAGFQGGGGFYGHGGFHHGGGFHHDGGFHHGGGFHGGGGFGHQSGFGGWHR
ncbi:MAG: hypothetical protein ACRERU_12670 [Methylococcales bacterium]